MLNILKIIQHMFLPYFKHEKYFGRHFNRRILLQFNWNDKEAFW